ncbi:MAG TPA: AI-2E family transporter [Candidatus Acidoferrum sp.]|nr:AI-2E family transporter [Candidatus Acidoferrum sp.]
MAIDSEPLAEVQYLRKISAFLTVVVIAVVFAFCYLASTFFLTIILASLLAILIDPIICLAERWKVNRSISSALVVVVVMVSLGAGVYWSSTRLSDLPESLPTYTSALKRVLRPLNQKIEKVQESAGSLTTPDAKKKKIEEVAIKQGPTWPSYLIQGVGSASSILISIGVLPFMVFFLLVGKERTYNTFQCWLGERIAVAQFSHRLTTMVRGFTIGNLVVGGVMSAATVGVLLAVHLPGAVPIGILSGFLNLIPFLGLILASLLPVAAGLLEFSTVGPFAAILATIVTLHVISSSFLIPKLIGSRVNIGPVTATLGVLFWGWLWGAMGLFLAIPLTAFVKLILDCYPGMIHLSNLMSETPRPVRSWRSFISKRPAPTVPLPEPKEPVSTQTEVNVS